MKEISTTKLVRVADLNHHGTLFAATAMAWLVETGFLSVALALEEPNEIVFVAMDNITYKRPVNSGELLNLSAKIVECGTTSLMSYVEARNSLTGEYCFSGFLTYVCIDKTNRKKKEHGYTLDDTNDEVEIALRSAAQEIKIQKRRIEKIYNK